MVSSPCRSDCRTVALAAMTFAVHGKVYLASAAVQSDTRLDCHRDLVMVKDFWAPQIPNESLVVWELTVEPGALSSLDLCGCPSGSTDWRNGRIVDIWY